MIKVTSRWPKFRLWNVLIVVAILMLAVGAFVFYLNKQSAKRTSLARSVMTVHGGVNLLGGQWSFMPGSSRSNNGLHIQARDFKIVEQDGSGGQPNPPVNEYGTHVIARDFQIALALANLRGPASIELYSTPPPVSDEFRVEVPSVRMTVDGSRLTVGIWNGKGTAHLNKQLPAVTHVFNFAPNHSGAISVSVDEQDGKLAFKVNEKLAGTVLDEQIFADNQVWFGLSADQIGGSFDVTKLIAKPLDGNKLTVVNSAAQSPVQKSSNTLQMLANSKRPGFLIGSDAALWAAASQSYDRMLFGGNFGIVTPENAMKWQFTEPLAGEFDFHEADALVDLAHKNGVAIHGHALVFGEALPEWVRDLPTTTPPQKQYVRKVMVDHITALVTHFKGRVHEWDVVNEPVKDYNDDGSFDAVQPLRENVFYRAMGADYINIALAAAHRADPNARLYINDYGNENDDGPRWQATYALMKNLAAGLKPQGIRLYYGFESHIYDPTTDDIANDRADNGRTILENNMNALGAIGIKSRISEMDAPLQDPGYDEDDSSQTAQLSGVLQVCLDNPNCLAFSMWSTGMTDIWQNDQHALQTGSVDSPFGQNNLPTGASYAALQRILRE